MKILKSKFLVFGIAAGLAAWWLLTRKNIGDKAKLLFKKISYAGGLKNPRFLLDFVIQNPTNQTGTISAVTGEVYLNQKLVADFSSFGEQKISARSSSPFRVEAKPAISALSLFTQKGLFKKGLQYEIRGTSNFDGIVVPFQYFGKL